MAGDHLILPSPLPKPPAEAPGRCVQGSTEKPSSCIKETYTEGYISVCVFWIKGLHLVNESWVCSFQYVEVETLDQRPKWKKRNFIRSSK